MQDKARVFYGKKNMLLPLCFLLPQLLVTMVFFFYPAGEAIYGSLFMEDAFGLSMEFVGLENFTVLFQDPLYRETLYTSLIFSVCTITLCLGVALFMALLADWAAHSVMEKFYKTAIIIPYAVAAPVAGVLRLFLFNASGGVITLFLKDTFGYVWNSTLHGGQAMFLIILAATWKQVSYNFLFFLAGLHAIPKSLIEAAAIDGAGPWQRFSSIVFPLLSPTTFFLLVVNTIYTLFETFGIVHAVTGGGPSRATEILIYKVYKDGFLNHDFGSSSAQSVILMLIVMVLTVVQFRYVERKVQY